MACRESSEKSSYLQRKKDQAKRCAVQEESSIRDFLTNDHPNQSEIAVTSLKLRVCEKKRGGVILGPDKQEGERRENSLVGKKKWDEVDSLPTKRHLNF